MSGEAATRRVGAGALVGVSTVLAGFAVTVFTLNAAGLRTPLPLLWSSMPLASIVAVISLVGVARGPGLPPATRRFWRHLTVSTGFVVAGSLAHAYDGLRGLPAMTLSAVAALGYTGSVVMNLWAMGRLPLRFSSRGDVLRAALDGLTVLLAAGAFSWHFVTRPVMDGAGFAATAVLAASLTMSLNLLSLFAVGKVALAGRGHLAPGVLPMLTLALIAGTMIAAGQRFVDEPGLSSAQVAIPVVMLCTVLAARNQARAAAGRRRARAGRRLPSWLPYLAIAAVDALLLTLIAIGHDDALPIGAVAVVLTGLVVARQQTVFRENASLVARLDHGATHDTLTGLPNRALFTERLDAALAADDRDTPVSVALIDLDDFKTVNDTLGHGVGDALLVAVADRLNGAVRAGDTVARLGGDEFVVVLEDIDEDAAEAAGHRIIAALAEPVVAEGHELLVRASIGLSNGHSGQDAADLLRRADIAMYAAKHDGGGNVRCYSDVMAVSIADTAALGARLRHAISDGQLFLQYQPIVALDTGRLRGVEALVRWAHPERGIVPPVEFIPVAERTGLIVPLGDWVLREACAQLAAWRSEHGDRAPRMLNVNVSARQLREAGFVERVAAILNETGVPAHRLTLEITESTAVALGEAVTRLDDLRRMGIRIALDDFGTGASTLTLLHELPVDQLKLDRSFTQGTDTSRRDTMPAAVIALADAVGLDLVAEGVETGDQAARLAELGYQHAQGYHFARPLPADAIQALMADHPPALAAADR
ncbi:bifunctional diguanylate cyclase/phosphodiesterase [Actinoplanes sichuanensis]|uniref:Bifunctional diguanylate cyclase/phosphodiesterase n=1 Tax=Actinoplanes sichuanensis TaxID=512349 RepID=A0ABW4AHB2_9ACTN|nr:EAL domain-containing protein [Actinoplanes sichuanensis]BEL02647.1 bifunctional diguanylate cyclase/phosphodiesterase [Actinoplanes sichuanensis]